jgi:hypothetical protein
MSGLTKIEYAAVSKILKEDMAGPVHDAAEKIAGYIEQHTTLEDATVSVQDKVTDRARSTVLLGHPGALAEQATSGILTRAVTSAGLEVGRKSKGL